jgi:hypothetical protein
MYWITQVFLGEHLFTLVALDYCFFVFFAMIKKFWLILPIYLLNSYNNSKQARLIKEGIGKEIKSKCLY